MSATSSKNPHREQVRPSTYLLTFVCYGSWLPGQPGTVPRDQNAFGTRLPQADADRERLAKSRMRQQPYLLDATRREIVLRSLQEVCFFRHWRLIAAHVRTNHVHVVV